MKKSVLSALTLVTLLVIFLSSCKPTDEPTITNLNIHFYPMVGNDALVYNQEYTINGRKLKFIKAQFYVSDVSLKKTDNTTSTPEMPYALVEALETNYSFGSVDDGTYSGLEFAVGVDSVANHGDPTQWGVTHPLYVNSLYASYWDWSQGYVFMKLEGYVDTTAAANGTASTGFVYHIGNDEMLRTIALSINKTIGGNEDAIELNVDYAKLLEDVDLRTELQTHSTANEPLAAKIANKAQEAITLRP